MQFEHWLTAQFSPTALVSLARIGKAIAEHDFACVQGRQNDLIYMLRSRRKHQRQFRDGRKSGGTRIQKQAPNFLSGVSSAGLSRHNNRGSGLAQLLRKAG